MVPVHVSHDRLEADDGFTIEPNVHPKHSVSRWVLRSHADHELVGVEFADLNSAGHQIFALDVVECGEVVPAREILGDFHIRAIRIDLLSTIMVAMTLLYATVKNLGWAFIIRLKKVFTQRIIAITFPHQDPGQIRMVREFHAHHVVNFTFLKIGPWPDIGNARQFALTFRLSHPNTQKDHGAGVNCGIEVVVDFDTIFVVNALKTGKIVVTCSMISF